jgi:hypothetical protein
MPQYRPTRWAWVQDLRGGGHRWEDPNFQALLSSASVSKGALAPGNGLGRRVTGAD